MFLIISFPCSAVCFPPLVRILNGLIINLILSWKPLSILKRTEVKNLLEIQAEQSVQIHSSTIDGNIEFVQLYSYVRSVISVFASAKIINYSKNFRIKCLSYSKIIAILCVLYFLFYIFYLNLENMLTKVRNFVFLVIFDTCDVMYHLPVSLLPPIVLDNLFESV